MERWKPEDAFILMDERYDLIFKFWKKFRFDENDDLNIYELWLLRPSLHVSDIYLPHISINKLSVALNSRHYSSDSRRPFDEMEMIFLPRYRNHFPIVDRV